MLPSTLRFTRTRLAPTPSGYLHLGNLFSFSLTAALASETGATVMLRIDDLDGERATEEFIGDIFESLSFLGIPYTGPSDPKEFNEGWSQNLRMPLYESALRTLADKGLVYVCTCSRRMGRICSNNCKDRRLPLEVGSPWRVRTDAAPGLTMKTLYGTRNFALPENMRDFVVRRRDGLPAYQLCSVVDDVHFGTDLIVRGQDLFDSTLAQLFLARQLDLDAFSSCSFVHHRLLYGSGAVKLSKSKGDTSIAFMRRNGRSAAEIYAAMGLLIGLGPVTSWRDLLRIQLSELAAEHGPSGSGNEI